MEKQDKEGAPRVIELERVKRRKALVEAVKKVIDEQPAWGYRRVRAWLVRRDGWKVSNKTVQKVLKEHGWQVKSANKTPRPRVKASSSAAQRPNILTPSEVKPPGALFEEVPCRMRDWPENNPVKNSFRGVLG